MFKKLVSNLPFSPSLVAQLGFYAQRLKKEQWMRRLGLIFTVFALIIQSFAIFSPPEPANASGSTRPEKLHISKPAEYITFNQYVDNELWGDEHNFVRVGPSSMTSTTQLVENIVAKEGQEYYLYIYVHNNAASWLNLVANNVKAQIISLNSSPATTQQFRGFIEADNCGARIKEGKQTGGSPCTFWDEAGFASVDGRKFTMEHVKGSAVYVNARSGIKFPLPDTIATASGNNGTLIGDTSMNGKIPGCAEHSGFVITRVRPKYEPKQTPSYDVEKKVNGTTHNVVKPGDTMTYTITAKNTGNVDLTNVKINDTLPAYYSEAKETLPAGATGSIINSPHVVTIPKLAVNATATITISYKVKGQSAFPCDKITNFINKVTGTTDQTSTEDRTDNNQVDTDVTYPCTPKTPNFDLEKTADKTTAKPGDIVNYTLVFRNTGDVDLTGVVIRDQLPDGMTLIDDSITVDPDGIVGKDDKDKLFTADGMKVGKVTAGQDVIITYSVRIAEKNIFQCGVSRLPNKATSTTKEVPTEARTDNNEWDVEVERICNCSDEEVSKDNPECATKKTAINNTQGGVDATTVRANGGDVITYTITMVNTEETEVSVTIKDSLVDVLEYATLTDYGGGTFDEATKILSWQATLKPGEATVRNFAVTVNSPVPAMAQGQNQASSYDCIMSNRYGTDVNIPVNCPPQKIIEQVVKELPTTGPGENIIFGGIVLAVVVFFYARSRQLSKEVRLIRREFNTGTL